MRDYQVPFNTREEIPFIMGLSIREMFWLGGGFMLGLFIIAVLFSIINAAAQNIILCLPAIIPSMGLAFFLAKKTVREDDHLETLDRHILKGIQYRFKPHIYVNWRKGV